MNVCSSNVISNVVSSCNVFSRMYLIVLKSHV
jgi:hypothetical protein